MGRRLLWRKTVSKPVLQGLTLLLALAWPASLPALGPLDSYAGGMEAPKADSQTATLPFYNDLSPPELYHLPVPEDELVADYLDYFRTDGKEWLQRAIERSSFYRGFIFSKLEELGAPPELYVLPIVESAYQNAATSRAGAAGLWQFMKNSISGFDMRVTEYLDERRDFWKATEGAIRKLKVNYRQLGDWNMAMAAYNAGLGRVGKIARKTGDSDFWSLVRKKLLPRETRGYVPQFMAIVKLMTKKEVFGEGWSWEPDPEWTRVPIDRTVDLRLLAEAAKLPYSEIMAANKELRYPITPAQTRAYHLKVPTDWAAPIQTALNDPQLKLIQFYFYKVRSGDTLSEIGRHYGVSMDGLQRYNPGLNPRYLKIGQTLIIPALKVVGTFEKVRTPAVIPDISATGSYKVQAGDTLWSIARKHGTTAEALAKANKIDLDATLRLGQAINVPEEAAEAVK